MQNDLQWPQIETFIHHIHGIISSYLQRNVTTAAYVIQHHVRQWRRQETNRTPFMNPRSTFRVNCLRAISTRKQVIAFFEESLVIAHVKLDGTNVGVDPSGKLFGRRTEIHETNNSYQSTDIKFLRESAEGVLMTPFLASLNKLELAKLRFRVYGELLCNNRHGYEDSGLYQSWRCFGAVADASNISEPARAIICQLLVDEGFALKDNLSQNGDSGTFRIVLHANDALRRAISFNTSRGTSISAGVDVDWCVPELNRGSLVEVVAKSFDWMLSVRGEGVVLTHYWPSAREELTLCENSEEVVGGGSGGGGLGSCSSSRARGGGGFVMAHKWKCSCEPQGKNLTLLTDLQLQITRLDETGLDFLLPRSIKLMVEALYQVAFSEPPATAKAKVPKKGKAGCSDGGACEQDESRSEEMLSIENALESAATKFDSLEAYFAKGAKDLITELLVEEVLYDLVEKKKSPVQRLPTSTSIEEAELKRSVRRQANRFVGTAFGQWLKKRPQRPAKETSSS